MLPPLVTTMLPLIGLLSARQAINLARKGGYNSLTKAGRFLAHDIDQLFLLLK
jgi:hypothetical protein